MAALITSTGGRVDSMPTPMPVMMVVAGPVSQALAILSTGGVLVPVKNSVSMPMALPATRPKAEARAMLTALRPPSNTPPPMTKRRYGIHKQRGHAGGAEGASVKGRLRRAALFLARTRKVPSMDAPTPIAAMTMGKTARRRRIGSLVSLGGYAQYYAAYDGAHIGFEEVGAHACHVAYVIADVVGYDGGIARVVFGYAGFYLADEVRAYVGRPW
jgi:hypothetical protein